MTLKSLQIHQVRNISQASLELHPQFNFFCGPNGSGKTSLLEAVHLLGSGHSFRTRESAPLVQDGATTATVYAELSTGETLSIQKSLADPTLIQINGKRCQKASNAARTLPCQLFYQDIFQIIDAGPSVRRKVLDWGLFHVKPGYHDVWVKYQRVIKQRNMLLRQQANEAAFKPWHALAHEHGEALHEMRAPYVEAWAKQFESRISTLLDEPCSLMYDKGWDKKQRGITLADVLEEQLEADRQRQYTFSGPHQADIVIKASSKRAKQWLSRGQQKMALIALKFAQSDLLEVPCLTLCDDVFAELDETRITRVFNLMNDMGGQFLITGSQPNQVKAASAQLNDSRCFELSQGEFKR